MKKIFNIPILVYAFLSLFLGQAAWLAFTNSTVSDEVAHIVAGYTYLKYDNFKLNPEHPPLAKQMAAVPLLFMDLKFPEDIPAWKDGEGEQWELGRTFLYKNGNPAEKMITASRLALLPLAILLGLTLFFWVRDLMGETAGIFAVFLYSLVPDLVINASLVTTDFAGAVFHFLTFYLLYLYFKTEGRKYLFGAGISAGLALISKFSMIQIYMVFYMIIFAMAWLDRLPKEEVRFPVWLLAAVTALAALEKTSREIFAFPVIYLWLSVLFPKWPVFKNKKIQAAVCILLALLAVSLVVPALDYFEPAYWFKKFRPLRRFFRGWAIFRDHAVKEQHPGFFLGQISNKGFKLYYLTAMLVKIPLAVWCFAILGFVTALMKKRFAKTDWLFILLPALTFWGIASFINKVNIGVRHVLPVYPYFLIFAAAGFQYLRENGLLKKFAAGALCVWLAASSALAFPNYLSYFNELAGIWGGGHNILSDSNISWGSDLKHLRDYVRDNKVTEIKTLLMFNFPEELDYYGLPWKRGEEDFKARKPGLYVLDVFHYPSLIREKEYAWLKTRKPDAKAGGSLWIYKL